MAVYLCEMSGEAIAGGGELQKLESQRSIPTPFLTKTFQIVDDPSLNDLISWNEDGTAFIVWQPAEFSRDLLPKYFKHNNFSSFVRQLNTYGFRKIAPDRWEFANDCFRRGQKSILRDIHRRKISTATPSAATGNAQSVAVAVAVQISPEDSGDEQVLSSTSSPAGTAATAAHPPAQEILEENERLKRENSQLSLELSRLKTLCSSIYNLMSSYAANPGEAALPDSGAFESMPETQGGAVKASAAAEDTCPRIFGVPIGDKRLKICEGHDRTTRGPDVVVVKSEPLDRGSSNSHDTRKG